MLARRLWLRWIYRKVDVALAVGSANRAYFRAHGLKERQIRWAPHSVDHAFFADPDGRFAAEGAKWRKKLGIPIEASVLIFAGKLESQKAPGLLLAAFAALGRSGVHLVFGGTGPMEVGLRENAPANVHFVGFQNQSRMPVLYRLGDVLVLPSKAETWGLVLNEAMACGLAVIASDKVGAAQDLIQRGRNGEVFPSGDCGALTAVLNQVLADPVRLQEMGRQSLGMIQDWSIPKQVDAIVAALLES